MVAKLDAIIPNSYKDGCIIFAPRWCQKCACSPFLLQIEEQQRIDTRERNRLGIEWKQKVGTDAHCMCVVYITCKVYLSLSQLFHAEGQAWVYNNPLSKRLKELDTCQQQ